MGRKKKYFTAEEKKAANRKIANLRYQRLKDNEEFKTAQRAQDAKYRSTQKGRAINLLGQYRRADRKYNRGECTLTADYIVEHIFSQPCHYCGETDWRKIGCNRLDNSLPHTPDNVEPCCWECNDRLGREKKRKAVYQYNLDGLLVAIWPSVNECGRNGYRKNNVAACCRGDYGCKTHKGFRWSYVPLEQACQLELKFE